MFSQATNVFNVPTVSGQKEIDASVLRTLDLWVAVIISTVIVPVTVFYQKFLIYVRNLNSIIDS